MMRWPDVGDAGKFEKVVELAKRRGFFWPSYEIYGGISGFIDYGPLGAAMKRKIEDKWLDFFVRRLNLMLIDTPIIAPKIVLDASGHTAHFTDPVTTCLGCGRKWRADHLLEEQTELSAEGLDHSLLDTKIRELGVRCPECGGALSPSEPFNELFKTNIGPYSDSVGYCRPETAQGMFVNFKRLYELARGKLPFGTAQIGRCLRNEISPRQGPIRLRELTIMELEFFFDPENSHCERLPEVEGERLRLLTEELQRRQVKAPLEVTVKEAVEKAHIKSPWAAYFMAMAKKFLEELGVPAEKQKFKEKFPWERAHYSAQTFDQVVELSRWGDVEVSGHAWRTDYDLKMHMAHSGVDLRAFTQYDSPYREQKLIAVPNWQALSESFGDEAAYVTRLLEFEKPEALKAGIESRGIFELRGDGRSYPISRAHVSFEVREVEETGRRFLANVVEPSFGLDRLVYAVLEYAYSQKGDRVVLRLPRSIAPIEVAVLPLLSREELQNKAKEIHRSLVENGLSASYDEAGSIGRRYARADEIGVPVAVTVDYETLENGTVTVRDRDSWAQVRVQCSDLPAVLHDYLRRSRPLEELGAPVKVKA